jgi:hypothetical protein
MSRVECPEIMLTNAPTNENEKAWNRGHVIQVSFEHKNIKRSHMVCRKKLVLIMHMEVDMIYIPSIPELQRRLLSGTSSESSRAPIEFLQLPVAATNPSHRSYRISAHQITDAGRTRIAPGPQTTKGDSDERCIANQTPGGESTHNFAFFSYT